MDAGLDPWTSAVLGAVQGVTEFLPVSSSGHVALGALLFGETELPLAMVVMLHVGTLVATMALFWDDLLVLAGSVVTGLRTPRQWLDTDEGKTVAGVTLATVPTVIVALILKDQAESWARVPWALGVAFLASSLAVASTRYGGGEVIVPTFLQAAVIGLAQGLAVLPGLSRSGTTIACAMALGLSGPAAFRFSFLMSFPVIIAAALYEVVKDPAAVTGLGAGAVIGGVVAMVVGYLALRWLRALVDQGRFWVFALYLIPLGLALLVWPSLFTGAP
ncbi:MAG: undecaprenyl-diphosphate phosphatase [Sandaracinaceae bacterium]